MAENNILVTGGAGYLGAVLVPVLLDAGYKVHVLDNFQYGGQSLAACCSNPNFQVTFGDCRDVRTLGSLVQKSDIIVCLAAIVGAPSCDADQSAAVSTNEMAIRLLKLSASPSQLIVFPNTNSGYGTGGAEALTEDAPFRPVSLYGRTKANAEKILLERERTVSLRFATLFGASPRMRLDLLVNDFVYRAVTDHAVTLYSPRARRNYLHVRDAARAILYMMEHPVAVAIGGRVYNVGLEANYDKLQLCERVGAHVPGFIWHEAEVGEDQDKRDYLISNERVRAAGFQPCYSLESGIIELVKMYQMVRVTQHRNV